MCPKGSNCSGLIKQHVAKQALEADGDLSGQDYRGSVVRCGRVVIPVLPYAPGNDTQLCQTSVSLSMK